MVFVVYEHYLLEGYYHCHMDVGIYESRQLAEAFVEKMLVKWQFDTWVDLKYHQFVHAANEEHRNSPVRIKLQKAIPLLDERPRYFGDQKDKKALEEFHAEKKAWTEARNEATKALERYDNFWIHEPAQLYLAALKKQPLIPLLDIPLLDGWRGKPNYKIVERNLNLEYLND